MAARSSHDFASWRWAMRKDRRTLDAALEAPVFKFQLIVKGLDTLIMREVPGYQGQAVLQSQSGNHWISATNRLTRAFEVGIDTPCQHSTLQVERQHLHGGQAGEKLGNTVLTLEFVKPFDISITVITAMV
jgi:hypothetical protein